MNARQAKKYLKKRITRLESDNDLMRRIIANSSEMQSLYDRYNMPLNVKYTTMPFQEFSAKRIIPVHMADRDGIIEYTKRIVAVDLFDSIKDIITYEVDTECMTPTITASIFVGRK